MADPIKLYLDEDALDRDLVKALRSRNVDILTAQEAGLKTVPDEEHLNYATSVGRTVFTFNRGDFVQLHTEYLSKGQNHAGIIVSNQGSVGVIIRRLLKLLDACSNTDMQNWLEFLSNWR
ncbi:MAG: DUF5615 family PIN-like protein [Anaerolineae bacterium]|nr:DUF5615 family PIN-like protein [Anaerolineae bacterium]